MAKKKEQDIKINVSFKKTEKDLYDFIKKQRSPSNYIKDAVEFYRQHYNCSISPIKKEASINEEPKIKEEIGFSATNLLDF